MLHSLLEIILLKFGRNQRLRRKALVSSVLGKEVPMWAVDDGLDVALYAAVCDFCIVHCESVSCWHRNSDNFSVRECHRLVQCLVEPFSVVLEQSSVLHKLDSSFVQDRAALWSIGHESNRSVFSVTHRNSRTDREVVSSNRVGVVELPSWPVVKATLDHFHSVAVSVEAFFIVKVLELDGERNLEAILSFW